MTAPLATVSAAFAAMSFVSGVVRAQAPNSSLRMEPDAGVTRVADSTIGPRASISPAADADQEASDATASKEGKTQHLSDLSLGNFFTAGCNQPWEKWRRSTPDMALLRVTTNFLEREFRLDYVLTNTANNPNLDHTDLANGLMAYGLNRRLMLEVIANYQWNVTPAGVVTSGGGGGFLARFQLVENATQSYSFQARVSPANKGIGQTQTSLTFGLAGWQDMHAIVPALGRFGLYYSFQYEDLVGTHKLGATQNDITYDVSVAETWTSPTTPVFGNFTTFLEAFATTILDGANAGKTTVSLTPGIRFWFIPENSFSIGVDLPVTKSPSFHSIFRATYILNF